MKSLRRAVSALTIAAGSAFLADSTHAQIPVTDAASITTQVTNQIETIGKWKMQYDQMTSQINQMQQQYASMTGTRNLGKTMNNPALRDYLPNDWQGIYDSVKRGGYSGLSGRAQSVYEANKIYDACAHYRVEEQRTACEAQTAKGAQDKAFALDAYDKAKGRLSQIDGLMSQINGTTDPKSIAELQGRIAAEQALIQNEQTKLQMYQMVAAAEDRLQEQRQREINAKALSNREFTKRQPFNLMAK